MPLVFSSCGKVEPAPTVVIQRDAVQAIAEEAFPIELDGTMEVPVPVTMREPFVLFLDGDAPVGLKADVAVTLPEILPSASPPEISPADRQLPSVSGEKTVEGQVLFSGHVVYRKGDRTLWIVGLEAAEFDLDGVPEDLAGPIGQAVADALLKRLQTRQVATFGGGGENLSVRDVAVIDGALHVSLGT